MLGAEGQRPAAAGGRSQDSGSGRLLRHLGIWCLLRSLPDLFGLSYLLGGLHIEELEFRVAMLVAEVFAVPIYGDGDLLRKPESLGYAFKVDFAESDFGRFSFQIDFRQWPQQVGAEAGDLVALRIDPGQTLGKSRHADLAVI